MVMRNVRMNLSVCLSFVVFPHLLSFSSLDSNHTLTSLENPKPPAFPPHHSREWMAHRVHTRVGGGIQNKRSSRTQRLYGYRFLYHLHTLILTVL